jgi:Spy/CpxP family protein refolding chaperone
MAGLRVLAGMERMLAILAAIVLAAATMPAARADAPTGYAGVPASVAAHCLSRHPGRLALTPEQQDQIGELLRDQPEGAARRAAIVDVLSQTQRMVYRNMAGIAAC